jgi:hypothetical protein
MSLEEAEEVPDAQSPLSINAVDSPDNAAM